MPQILEENKVMFKVHAGEAESETEKYHLSYSLQGTPIVTFEDGTIVYWTWEELIEEAIKLKEGEHVNKT